MTAAEYLQRLEKACWSEVTEISRASKGGWSDSAPCVTSIRRSLRREYLGLEDY